MITFNLMIGLIFFTTIEAYSTMQSGFEINTIFSVSLSNFPLRNIAYDELNNSFYISGKNILYKFSLNNSALEVTKVTGPKYTCFAQTSLNAKYCGDDENSVIVVTPDYLITCSTLYGGRCIRRNKLTLSEGNSSVSYIQLVSNITVSALAKLVNITVLERGVRYTKKLLLFAKTPTELPQSVENMDRSVVFSVEPDLQGKVFAPTLREDGIFDLFLKTYENISTVDYRSIFENEDFVFLLFNQNSKAKLAKLCKSIDRDDPKRVYEDIPISCKNGNKTFNVVVHGKFINAPGARYLTVMFLDFSGYSALCMFSESEIYTAFLKSRRNRYSCPKQDLPPKDLIFEDSMNLPKCVDMSRNASEFLDGFYDAFNREYYCNNVINSLPQFGIIIGILPLIGKSVYGTQNIITVIGDHIVNNLTSLYLGTHNGRIIKLFVNESLSVHYIGTIKIDNSKIKAIIGMNGVPVILTENKIVNITSADCEEVNQSCSDCMLAKSAYCGWCISKHRFSSQHYYLCSWKIQCKRDPVLIMLFNNSI